MWLPVPPPPPPPPPLRGPAAPPRPLVAEEVVAKKPGRPAKRPAGKDPRGCFGKKKTNTFVPPEELEAESFAPADAVPHVASVTSVLPVETPAESWLGVLSRTVNALTALPALVRTRGGLRQTLWAECVRIRGIVIDHGLSFAPAVLTQLVALGGPRREYSQRDIEIMLKVDEAVRAAHGTAADAATAIQTVPGFEHVDRRHLARWKLCMKDIEDRKPGGLRGRKVDRDFEALVMSKLVVMVAASPVGDRAKQYVVGVDEDLFDPLDINDDDESELSSTVSSKQQPERCVVKENIAYSFALVMRAGLLAQKQFPADDAKIQGLKFSSRWVQGFLRRNLFKRRRVVTDAKTLPTITGELMRPVFILFFSVVPSLNQLPFDHFARRNHEMP